MPIYEYRCQDCSQMFEEWQKDFQSREVPCPVCGGKSERLISTTSFVLKGSGWYVTDYCSQQSRTTPSTPGSGSLGTDSPSVSAGTSSEATAPGTKPAAASPQDQQQS